MYTSKLTATLTGATPGQLSYWRTSHHDQPPILTPAYGTKPVALYSYEDLIALRMFVSLRKETSLQKVRRAVETLRKLSPGSHLSTHSLKTAGNSIVWLTPEGDFLDVVEQPGQPGIRIVMERIFRAFTTADGRTVPDLNRPAKGVTIDPEIRGGYPVVEGTRIPYDTIAGLASDGLDLAQIHDWYPDIPLAAVEGSVNFAREVNALPAA